MQSSCPSFTPESDAECVHSNVRARADLLNDLRVLIRRCRIKAAFNTSSDNGFELRVALGLNRKPTSRISSPRETDDFMSI